MKKNLLIGSVLVVSFGLITRLAVAQEVAMPDEDWGEHQNFQKAAEYWAWWERTGPDTNITVARRAGQKEFTSMRRSKAMMMTSQAVIPAWKQVGGTIGGVVSGRPTGLGFSKQHPAYIYLTTSGGGLFKSTNSGGKWVPIDDPNFTTNAMGGVAVDPSNDSVIYVGTGDLYTGNDGELSKGDGMFKSVDGGLNWTKIANTTQVGTAIYQVLIDPANPARVYTTATDGIHRSEDAGATWKKVLSQSGTTHMIIDPNNTNRLIAGGAGTIKMSTDYGATWTGDLASNIGSKYTVTLGISRNSDVVFASVGSTNGNSVGVAKSTDSGNTWAITMNPGGGYMSQQSFYDNACAVSPSSSNYVIVGGLDIYASANGGTSFPYRTDWTSAPGGNNYTHADIHVLTYGGGGLWALTDGGVFQSGDNGKTWAPRNAGLATLLFVGGDADKNFTFALGGAQDNGVSKTNAMTGTTFTQKVGGDGGRCYVDQIEGLVCYSTYVSASLQRSPDGGESWDVGPRGDHNVIPNGCPLLNEGVPFYMYYDVCESDPAVVAVAGGSNVYYTTDGAVTLNSISKSGTKPSSPVTVHIPAANSAVVYCGAGSTSYTTKDASVGAWTKTTTASLGTISDWASDPKDAGHVWVAISGFGGKHFAESVDYGATWTFPATGLPNLNYQAIARAPNGDLFLGHTLGVLRSIDGGVNWEALTDGIPLAQVNKLRVRGGSTKYLLATTYGHGMYSIDITNLPRTIVPAGTTTPAEPAPLSVVAVTPNPVMRGGDATVMLTTNSSGWLNMRLFDDAGREVKTLANEYAESGSHVISVAVPSVAGSYTIVVTHNGKATTAHLVVNGL